jgi:hypothetical protein
MGLSSLAKLVGGASLLAVMAYCAYRMSGFRDRSLTMDFGES